MELRTLSCRLEPIFHQAFGSFGLFLARRGGLVALLTTILLIGLSFGLFALEVESDAIELTVSRRGRIHREKEYYEDHFAIISPELSSFIITPKTGHSLLTTKSLNEVVDLQNWIRTFTFEPSPGLNVSLEQFCFKSVDSEAQEPCYQASILDCFSEGAVFNIGGDKNAEYQDFYSTKKSFTEVDFQEEFNTSFVQEQCRGWTGTPNSIPIIMAEVIFTEDGSSISDIGALQIAFGTRSAEALASKGLEFVDWIPTTPTEQNNGAVCPDVSKCEPCADALEASRFLRAGCRIGSQDQPGSCCDELELVRESPCIQTIFERQPTAGDLANPLFSACGIDRVELSPRCTNQLLMHGSNAQKEEEVIDNDICNCLRNQNSSECTQSIAALSGSYPELNTVFLGVDGSPGSQESITEYLVDTFDCVQEDMSPTMELPEVCVCLEDRTSSNCRSAATAYALENPEHIASFTAASQDDPTAVEEIASLLSTLCQEEETGSINLTPELAISSTINSTHYKASVKIIKELTSTVKEAEDLLHDWESAWKEAIVSKIEDFETIDVTWVASRSLDDAAKDAANAQTHLIAMGYLLVLLYIIGYFAFERKEGRIVFSKLPPGPVTSALCFLCVLLGVAATFGVLSLFSLTSFKATATTIQIVPLLAVGLGVNDLFVLVSALLTVLDKKRDLDEIMFEAMAIGGTSITLSSFANTSAFALGMLSPIPIVMWFSFQMMIGVLIAYFVSMTIIPSILAYATSRWLKKSTENLPKETRIQSEMPGSCPEQDTPRESSELGSRTGQCPSRGWQMVLLLVLIGYFAWLGVSIVGLTRLNQGLNLSEAVEKDSRLHDYLINKERYFQSYSINLVFSGEDEDYSNPDIFAESRSAEFHFIEDGYKTDREAGVLSWFDFYTRYVESKLCSNEICLTEVNWYYDHLSSEAFGDPNRNLCSNTRDPEDCEGLCGEYCPQGPITTQFKCRLSEDKESCYCPWKPILKPYLFFENPVGFDSKVESYWSDFLTNTSIGLAARNLIDFKEESKTERNLFGVPVASRSVAYVNEMLTTGERLRHIRQSRQILDNAQVEVYPFDYVVFAMGEQYDDLGMRTITAVGISLAIATVVMIPLIASWITALLVALCIGSGIVLSAGTIHWLDLKLNYASYVSLIVAVGLMVEFCAHIARDFMLAEGDRITRSRHAIKTMGVAVLNGGITTFLGLLPVALSNYGYFQKYYFVQYSVVVSVGLLTGLVLLPVVLALIGPPSFMSTFTSKTNIEKSNRSLTIL